MALFEHGFGDYLRQGALSDLVLSHPHGRYPVRPALPSPCLTAQAHRIMLCYSSRYFQRLLGSGVPVSTLPRPRLTP